MADNLGYTVGSGATVAADDIAGIHYQRVKIAIGADGTNDGDVAAANPLPIQLTRPSSASHANVSGSASNVTLLASNAARKGASIFNDSTAALYIKFGATASTTSFKVKVAPGGYFEVPQPCYTGVIDGIWDSATGAARVTEES